MTIKYLLILITYFYIATLNCMDQATNSEYVVNEALLHACINGDFPSVRQALCKGAEINYCTKLNYHGSNCKETTVTPLIAALLSTEWEIAKFLITHGACVTIKDSNSTTILFNVLIKDAPLSIIRLLCLHKANVNEPDQFNSHTYPLQYAMANGKNDMVKTLLFYGAKASHVISCIQYHSSFCRYITKDTLNLFTLSQPDNFRMNPEQYKKDHPIEFDPINRFPEAFKEEREWLKNWQTQQRSKKIIQFTRLLGSQKTMHDLTVPRAKKQKIE